MAGTADWYNARTLADDDIRFLAVQHGNLQTALDAAKRIGVSLVFIDTPPAATPAIGEIMKLADLVLVPVIPSPDDLRALQETLTLVKQADKPFMFVLNEAKAGERLTKQATRYLLGLLRERPTGRIATTLIGYRQIYRSCKTDGRTVVEMSDKKAVDEIEYLWMEVSTLLKGGSNGKGRR